MAVRAFRLIARERGSLSLPLCLCVDADVCDVM